LYRYSTDREESPDPRGAAECAVAAGVLGPLVAVFASSNQAAVVEAASALEHITVEIPAEQDRALRAGALDACLRLISTAENDHGLRAAVGGCTSSRMQLTHSLKPPGCNP
jgi:hypothetical protein